MFERRQHDIRAGDGRSLLVSDIPNDRILRWDEASGAVSTFRQPSNNANGNFRDRQGRLLTCEHLTRRVTRTEYDGRLTVLADRFDGKRLNSPNDIVCARDGSVWFTDPPFGIHGYWEGAPAEPELPQAVYRIAPDGRLQQVLWELTQSRKQNHDFSQRATVFVALRNSLAHGFARKDVSVHCQFGHVC